MENTLPKPGESMSLIVESSDHLRLDQFLVRSFVSSSRTFFQKLIADGRVMVNNVIVTKPSYKLSMHEAVSLTMPQPREAASYNEEIHELGVQLVYEHEHFLVLSKPAGLVVHPPHPTSQTISLIDWLTYYYRDVSQVGVLDRPGIVHRLDKDTSGLIIVARTPYAHATLSDLFKNRSIQKTYIALVEGRPPASGVIDLRISRHPVDSHKMTYKLGTGRDATTYYRVREYFKGHALLELRPVTGRTHQIRVHCAGIDLPLIGDTLYGSKSIYIGRQALHAEQLSFEFDGVPYTFIQKPPQDFERAVELLRII